MKKMILFIEDDYLYNYASKRTVQEFDKDIEVLIALNGTQALNMLCRLEVESKLYPYLIFMDFDLPKMAYDFMQRLARFNFYSKYVNKIIALTSDGQVVATSQYSNSRLGTPRYIKKPFSDETLFALLMEEEALAPSLKLVSVD
jgi:CheY-like chemotaxis protein